MCGLRIFDRPGIYDLPGNVISATVEFIYTILLSILTCSPNMSFLARLFSDNSRSLEKFELGAPSSPTTPKKFLHGVQVIVHVYLRIRFDLLSSINFRDISSLFKLGPITLIKGHPRGFRVVPLDSMVCFPISH